MKKILALLLVAIMVFALAACKPTETKDPTGTGTTPVNTDSTGTTPVDTTEPEAVIAELRPLVNKEYGTDYVSLYSKFGKDVTIEEVIEDPETGFAYIERDGVRYMLGMDFLSMATVYNCEATCDKYPTPDDVYAAWWRLYMQRWNYMVPEIPLYSNEYYDLYNTKIGGVQENPTNPYWDIPHALIDWTSTDGKIIIGNNTDLSGKFRYANFGASNPGASDLSIQNLTAGQGTVETTKTGNYEWNPNVVVNHEETENADGSKTFKIEIAKDLKFSDGTPIDAYDYVGWSLAFSSPVAAQAAGKDHMAGMRIVGYNAFANYTGPESEGTEVTIDDETVKVTKVLSGLRVLDDYTFSVTIDAEHLPYYYDITYASFTPEYLPMWIGNAEVKDDGNGCYLTDEFYAKEGDGYAMAATIKATSENTDTTYPYTGAYTVESYDAADKTAVLKANPNFKGNYEGAKPAIEQVVWKKTVSQTQLADLQSGGLDIVSNITGGAATNEAIKLADESNGKYAYTHYSRAGYGKLGMRCDYGPVQFVEVRQAIAYCMDRAQFAKDFTGGYGGVVDGPYYSGSWMYQAATAQGMLLNAYSTSVDSAIEVLENGGWIYDKDGNPYTSGVRYKQIPADEISENDKVYKSKDGAYVTTQVGDFYYMPLALNWFGTSDNEFSDLLVTGFMNSDNIAAAGFVVQNTFGEFQPMQDELYQAPVYGFYSGTPMYCCFNFATGFTSAIYDYSYNWTIDPSMYGDYSIDYVMDEADAYWLA